jgi:guanosine-3',5'-bis(diphosphate) 3'-pyrophosphohydrolase
MQAIDSIISELKKTRKDPNIKLIQKAFDFAQAAHLGQKRKSGEDYFVHPVEVAHILATHNMDEESIVAGLLHDVVEDTKIPLKEIDQMFGSDVAEIVDGLTKLSGISFQSKDERKSESFRKMLLAMSKDIRVIIIKLVDRLHNMRTLEHMKDSHQQAIAQETLDIYAPLAHRLGISWIKTELENLSFKFIHPEAYDKLQSSINASEQQKKSYVDKVMEIIREKMKKEGINCEVTGRHKHLFSIYRKMEIQNLGFEQIADLVAFRIIVDKLTQCYEVLGHIHATWKPVPGKFKDYIALPKANMYQSLHTTVIGPSGNRIEIQIRTHDMHEIAEEGIAAHWTYKTPEKTTTKELQQLSWIKKMLEWQEDLPDSHQFMESVKIDLYSDEVYVFTPKGEVIELPNGSTPIDFAYEIHTEVGQHCKGAKINEKMVPLKRILKNGDTISIITDPNAHPTKDWLKVVKTSKSKSKIRGYLREKERETGRIIGKDILDKELKRNGLSVDKLQSSGKMAEVLKSLHMHDLHDLYLSIGYGKTDIGHILQMVLPVSKLATRINKIFQTFSRGSTTAPVQVGGLNNILVRFGKCCNPLAGDPIVGFVTRGKGITVHKQDCHKILEMDHERKIIVEWAKEGTFTQKITIKVITKDVPGILADISKVITKGGANIANASCKTTKDLTAVNMFDLMVKNSGQLRNLMRNIESLKGIISVERFKK